MSCGKASQNYNMASWQVNTNWSNLLESSHQYLQYQLGSPCTGTQGGLSLASTFHCSIGETTWHTFTSLKQHWSAKILPMQNFIWYTFWICGRFAFICGRFADICGRFALWFLHVFWCQSQISSSECHFSPSICNLKVILWICIRCPIKLPHFGPSSGD